jgi:hypothetical protein
MTDEAASANELRASYEDRDRAVDLLRVAAGDGRLTSEELDERLGKALTARTHGELAALTKDLPATIDAIAIPAITPKDVVHIDCRLGSTKRDGRWVVPHRIDVKIAGGSVILDFTDAVITQPLLHIDAHIQSGTLTLVTRHDTVVDADDVRVQFGSMKVRTPSAFHTPVAMRIHVAGEINTGTIIARPQRRSFWQWLVRRHPKPSAPALPGS